MLFRDPCKPFALVSAANQKLTRRVQWKKLLCVMKLTAVILLAACLQVSAKGNSQQISLHEENVSLQKVFKQIQKQSGYNFLYSFEVLSQAGKVNINVKNVSLEEALKQCLKDKPLEYSIVEKTIVIRPLFVNTPSAPIEIKGQVVNEDGEPMKVTVAVKGTDNATSTNDLGQFVLQQVEKDAVLVISGVNIQTVEIKVAGKTELLIRVKLKIKEVETVVITGYQTLDSRRSAGAFGFLGADKIEKRPSVDLISAMEGMFSGLRVYDEGGGTNFDIRGIGTMTHSVSSPLIVVDGFPVANGFSGINPNDVQSIHVLKDAAATSIWGARASNGVIVITTKRAKPGLHVEINSFIGIQQKPDLDQANPIASAADALEWEKFLWENDQLFSSFSISSSVDGNNNPVSLGITLLNLRDQGRISPAEFEQRWSRLKQNDYRNDVNKYLLQKAVTQNYDVTVSGASERNSFVFNTRFVEEKSQFKDNYNKSILANFRNTYRVTRWLDANIGLMAKFTRRDNSGASLNDIKSISPYETLVDESGNYTKMVGAHYQEFIDSTGRYFPNDWNYNLLQEVRSREIKTEQNDIRFQLGLNFKLFKGLNYETKFQYEQYKTENKSYYSPQSYFVRDQLNKWVDYDEPNKKVLKSYLPEGGQLMQSFASSKTYNFRNQVTYDRAFDDHEITAGLITEIFSRVSESYNAPVVYGYDPDKLSMAVPQSYVIKSYWGVGNYQLGGMNSNMSYNNDRFFSLLGNTAYTYKRRYTISGSFRIDASNLIVEDPKKRYSPFWSVGGNWKVDQENFMDRVKEINRLNLRVSYGQTGNVVLSTSVVPLITISGIYPLTGAPYASIEDYGNPTLTWERTATLNFGIDYSLFSNKLYGSLEVYNKHGRDIVGAIDIPRLNGTSTQEFNTAEILNKGFEFNVGTTLPVGPAFTWNSNLNFSYNKSKVLNLLLLNYNYFAIRSPHFEEDRPVDAIYSYNYLGENGTNAPYLQGAADKTFTFNDVHPVTADDREYMQYSGSAQPTTVIGFQNGISAYGFNLFVIVNGEFGHVFRRPTFDYGILTNSKESSTVHRDLVDVLNNSSSDIPNMPTGNVPNLAGWGGFAEFLNTTIEKANNIRLKEVNFSYDIPAKTLSVVGIKTGKVFFQLRDPKWIWVKNDEKLDPMYIFNNRASSSPAAITYLRPAPSYKIGVSFGF